MNWKQTPCATYLQYHSILLFLFNAGRALLRNDMSADNILRR